MSSKKKADNVQSQIRYPEELYKKIVALAKQQNRSINNLVITILQDHFEK